MQENEKVEAEVEQQEELVEVGSVSSGTQSGLIGHALDNGFGYRF